MAPLYFTLRASHAPTLSREPDTWQRQARGYQRQSTYTGGTMSMRRLVRYTVVLRLAACACTHHITLKHSSYASYSSVKQSISRQKIGGKHTRSSTHTKHLVLLRNTSHSSTPSRESHTMDDGLSRKSHDTVSIFIHFYLFNVRLSIEK